ncbi:PKD domain-containing protein [Ferruginibacter profundus]
MRKLFTSLLFIVMAYTAMAEHTKGGWMYYTYLGPGSSPNSARYRITLKIYTKCVLDNPAQYCPTVVISIFSAASNSLLERQVIGSPDSVNMRNCPTAECHPCVSPLPAPICYKITTYEFIKELPITAYGYTISYQRCCRISGIINLKQPTFVVGDTWTVNIPGNAASPLCPTNSSARFPQNDTAIICRGNYFTYNFGAIDLNNDSLSYAFTNAYAGTPDGGTGGSCANEVSLPPPYNSAEYQAPYTGSEPLGKTVKINPYTGMVSGIAPDASGVYVLTVTVTEFIKGTTIKRGEVRKSLHIEVADCVSSKALLEPEYYSCDDFDMSFSNGITGNIIQSFYWEFGDPASGVNNTSDLQFPSHTYSGPGDYVLKLVVNRGLSCSDSTTSIVKVYPVFKPDFKLENKCANAPVQFTDLTTSTYGNVNFWYWNFGDFNAATGNNISSQQNPTHVYSAANSYDIRFIVANNKGCTDTVLKTILITSGPSLSLTHDTLMCTIDTVQLNAIGTGTFSWSPNYNISSVNSSSPLVSPDVTTTYRVTLTDDIGCIAKDSVKVNVVSQVSQLAPNDTTICTTDDIVLHLVSDALTYQWTESPAGNTLSNPNIKNPIATPVTNTTYNVVGSIGKCIAQSSITIKAVPYPAANAGADQTICLGNSTQLFASGGSSYSWSPAAYLNNRLIADPTVTNPTANTKYVVSITDTLGCPKPGRDTVIVFVAKIKADAGPSDTSVVLDQPLVLNASGSTHYLWSPAQWLSNPGIANPVALPQSDIRYIVKVSNDAGCFDYDSITVHLFKLDAGIYVPNAFTPNGDGNNDYFHPILIGMRSLDLFKVFNRWGQLVYSSTGAPGWDGSLGGKKQETSTYVWYAEGTDYKNNKIKKKGYVMLLR